MRRWSFIVACVMQVLAPSSAHAQEPIDTDPATDEQTAVESIDLRVTVASGRTLTVDRGRSSGLRAGDRVMFLPLGASAFEGVVRLVEENSAQVDLDGIELSVEPGLRGEVRIPAARLEELAQQERKPATPEHPPWQRAPEEWDQSKPLLAPVESPTPDARPSEVHGRAYTLLDFVDDNQGGDRQYLRSLTGFDTVWTNPFGAGGRLTFDGAFSYRVAESDGETETESILRLERLSYAWGGDRDRPHRVEVGRFLSHEFPELGILDGVEYAYRLKGGSRIGASFGGLAVPFDKLETDGDVAASVFFRVVTDERETLALGGAFQKTWHDGEADRDLFLATADWRIAERTFFRGAAWVDFYGSEEQFEDEGVELTQLQLRVDQRFAKGGLGLFASRYKWPDLLRDELPTTTTTDLPDFEVSRVGIDGWGQVSEHLRLGARIEAWEDEEDDGNAAELRVGLPDLLWDRGTLDLSVFGNQGRFSDVFGGRISAMRWFGPHALRLTYELRQFEQSGFTGEQSTLLQDIIRAGFDMALGRNWNVSIDTYTRFGDEQDAFGLTLYLQRSF